MATIKNLGEHNVLYPAGTYRIERRPLWWHDKGLWQTASGYGRTLATSYVLIGSDGRVRRVYCCCNSNSGTCYIVSRGVRYLVPDSPEDAAYRAVVQWGPYGERGEGR